MALWQRWNAFGRPNYCLSQRCGLNHPSPNACQGFDEYMNVVMDDTSEVYVKGDRPSLPLGLSCMHACPFPPHNSVQGESFSRETISRSFNPSKLVDCFSGSMICSRYNPLVVICCLRNLIKIVFNVPLDYGKLFSLELPERFNCCLKKVQLICS